MRRLVIMVVVLLEPGAPVVQASPPGFRDACPPVSEHSGIDVNRRDCDGPAFAVYASSDSVREAFGIRPTRLLVRPEPVPLILALAAIPFLVARLSKRRRPMREHTR